MSPQTAWRAWSPPIQEIGDWHRFTGATIGAYLGLVPSEHSTGASRSQGAHHQDRQHPTPANTHAEEARFVT